MEMTCSRSSVISTEALDLPRSSVTTVSEAYRRPIRRTIVLFNDLTSCLFLSGNETMRLGDQFIN